MEEILLTRRGPEDGGNFEYQWADGYLASHYISDVGRKREHNEDSVILCSPEDEDLLDARGCLFAVADGMGGASAGELASQLALESAIESFYTGDTETVPEQLREAIETANATVFRESQQHAGLEGMGTTFSALVIRGDGAYVGQVGDSRVYLSRGHEGFQQITEDHSLVAEQLRSGLISEEEAENHSLKNMITRAVGIKLDVEVDLFSLKIQQGDSFLLCSDGLCNLVDDDDITNALRMDNIKDAARILVGKALEAGGNDNVSVAVVRVVGEPSDVLPLQKGGREVDVVRPGFFRRLLSLFF
ncbi:MAG: Stp1/IreP family PP2C-type Ser/Thr phosphatase [Candidatus Hydrogenedentes bacterium]|jgi:protein phosphatase|nr:Stp1/IreP family PP2C-type Ser/Thr phosphatase [Candidatus Hydrogenedentota bacterium]